MDPTARFFLILMIILDHIEILIFQYFISGNCGLHTHPKRKSYIIKQNAIGGDLLVKIFEKSVTYLKMKSNLGKLKRKIAFKNITVQVL